MLVKKLFLLALSFLVFSCETIKVAVQSEKKVSYQINRHSPLVFLNTSEGKEASNLRTQCKRGIVFAGLKIDEECEDVCKFVTVSASSSEVDAGLLQRNLQVAVFADRDLKSKVFQASVSTTSEKKDVSAELCEAAFQAYPETIEKETFNIHPRVP